MPKDFDLDKDRYRVRTRNGRWVVRDKPWQFIYGFAIVAAGATFLWWNRSEVTLILLMTGVAIVSFLAGMLTTLFLKRFD